MKCEHCGKESCVIYITRNHKKVCDSCYDLYYRKGGGLSGEETMDTWRDPHTYREL